MSHLKTTIGSAAFIAAGMMIAPTATMAADIGFVLAGPDVFYATGAEVFETLAEQNGHRVSFANSEYSPSKELANVEDFIARGVDVIVLLSANAEAGTQAAQRAKDAGIPIFFQSALPTPEGYQIPDGIVSGNWIAMGKTVGLYVGENYPGENVALIEGFYGQGTTELIRKGFEEGVAESGGGNEVVLNASGNWNRKDGLAVAQDFIASQKDFKVIYAMNEEMMAGTIQAIEEAGKQGEYALFSDNGKEIGWQWMKDGVMEGTVANPPTLEGDIIFQMVQAHLDGKDYPRHVYNTQPWLTADNLDGAIPWDVEDYFARKASGEIVIDLFALAEVDEIVTWDSSGASN
ncbi:MAG: sugar ABC transporter substrate-binding protein [Hyphomicrobiales bacterium]|nr:sugar ABC transporter substrate-binding protein [Hyphomicrobiales bacterium]